MNGKIGIWALGVFGTWVALAVPVGVGLWAEEKAEQAAQREVDTATNLIRADIAHLAELIQKDLDHSTARLNAHDQTFLDLDARLRTIERTVD